MTLPLRAALYVRVSTARQVKHDVSIPTTSDRAKPIAPHAATSSSKPIVEPGASATNDRQFQRMIDAARPSPRPLST
jgi:site-specific DNA recombinase